jgi:hypothetical protein
MSRKKHQVASLGFPTLSLPDLDSFSDDEKLLARVTVGIVRGGGAMYGGRFIECIVARLLDAGFPLLGTSPWDLLLGDGTRIEVRSGATFFSLKGVKDVDLWVFVYKGSSDALFSVATATDVAALGARSISATRLASRFPPVGTCDLAATVAAVRGGRRGVVAPNSRNVLFGSGTS